MAFFLPSRLAFDSSMVETVRNSVKDMMPPKKRRLMLLGGPGGKGADDETCATFVFEGESHTLGKFSKHGISDALSFCLILGLNTDKSDKSLENIIFNLNH